MWVPVEKISSTTKNFSPEKNTKPMPTKKKIVNREISEIDKLNDQIELLQKQKELELLRIEVEKLKKTTVVEETVIHRTVDRWENIPGSPYPQPFPYNPIVIC